MKVTEEKVSEPANRSTDSSNFYKRRKKRLKKMNRISEACLDHMKQCILHLVEFPGEKRERGAKYT